VSVTSNPYESATYYDVNKWFTPDDVVFVISSGCVRNRFHVLEESNLGLAEEFPHSIEDWNVIGVDGS
jgi:hypothetical protein